MTVFVKTNFWIGKIKKVKEEKSLLWSLSERKRPTVKVARANIHSDWFKMQDRNNLCFIIQETRVKYLLNWD